MKRLKLGYLILFTFILSGCSNSFYKSLKGTVGSSNTNTANTSTTANDNYVISSVNISNSSSSSGTGNSGGSSSSSSSSSTTFSTTIFFNVGSSSKNSISTHCNIGTSGGTNSKPCLCQFTWNETNPNSGSSLPVSRVVQTSVTNVQSNLVSCNAPDRYSTEIPSGTQIQITVLPGPGNPDSSLFSVSSYTFTNTTTSGGFNDSQGNLFINILRYSCFDKFSRGLVIQNKTAPVPNSHTGVTLNAVLGTQFCFNTANGSGGAGVSSCSTLPPTDFSAQSYYYNLYIRSTEAGDVNYTNNKYICPTVTENLYQNQNGSGIPVGPQGNPWPFDATFALSLGQSTTFNVGVEGFTKLSNGSDPVSANNTCAQSTGTNGSSSSGTSSGSTTTSNANTFIRSCLGFAASPNSDGTCPNVTDSSTGLVRPTFRLRRFVAIYPLTFDTNGKTISNQGQATDTIYVLDRPVKGPPSSNPLKSYTMLGPKPCPFAFFDQKGVTGQKGYYGTNNTNWASTNIDGIEFPNIDGVATDGSQSCSTSFPILSSDKTRFGITTINKNISSASAPNGHQHVYVRPTQPFAPHYEEDTDFKACAPQASPFQDAPLHFARDPQTGNVGWCAEAYPTQNNNVGNIDSTLAGNFAPFTSHVSWNTTSNTCVATPLTIPAGYPAAGAAAGYARHNGATNWETYLAPSLNANASQTCDRTVMSTGLTFARFPLLAPAQDVENAISSDYSYMCYVTYDAGGGKTNKQTPSDGCCNKAHVKVTTGSIGVSSVAGVAHLGPDSSCLTPNY
jgi:hypothetical protein